MSGTDPYNVTDKLGEDALSAIVTRLEARGKHPRFLAMLDDYLAAMRINDARKVLDMGCGTGVAARQIARRAGFWGEAHGVDLGPGLIAAARRFADGEGLSGKTRFDVGDTHSLDLPEGGYDAVVAHTLISHVDDPSVVMAEARRLVKPGGLIGVFDGDYASLNFTIKDLALNELRNRQLINGIITQPDVMRRLPRLAAELKLEIVETFAYVVADIGRADFWLTGVQSFAALLPRSGAMTNTEAQSWVAELSEASKAGTFFGSSNFYSYVLRRV